VRGDAGEYNKAGRVKQIVIATDILKSLLNDYEKFWWCLAQTNSVHIIPEQPAFDGAVEEDYPP
jgi:hypothetical protein